MSGAAAGVGLAARNDLADVCVNCPLCESRERTPLVSHPTLTFVTCAGCGLIYKSSQSPGLTEKYAGDYVEKGWTKYLARWEHRVRKCTRQLLATLEHAPHARTVLDVGCAAGYMLEAARRLGLDAAGVDNSQYIVQVCKERGYRVEFGDLLRLPFESASFDIVTAKHTLEHTEQPLAALKEMRRVLRPGGVLLLIVPDALNWQRFLRLQTCSYFRPERAGWQHVVYYREADLASACERTGLVVARVGKPLFRRRLARGLRAPYEAGRAVVMTAVMWLAKALHLRREIQVIAQMPRLAG